MPKFYFHFRALFPRFLRFFKKSFIIIIFSTVFLGIFGINWEEEKSLSGKRNLYQVLYDSALFFLFLDKLFGVMARTQKKKTAIFFYEKSRIVVAFSAFLTVLKKFKKEVKKKVVMVEIRDC